MRAPVPKEQAARVFERRAHLSATDGVIDSECEPAAGWQLSANRSKVFWQNGVLECQQTRLGTTQARKRVQSNIAWIDSLSVLVWVGCCNFQLGAMRRMTVP